jgi:uncharacterized protein YrrD
MNWKGAAMQFHKGANVFTPDEEEIGQIDRLVIDPRNQEITHLVIRKGLLVSHSKVVPIEAITVGPAGNVTAMMNSDQFKDLPDFEEKDYVLVDESTSNDTSAPTTTYWYPHYLGGTPLIPMAPGPKYIEETRVNIPPNTVPVKEGARVITRDGDDVGQVQQVLTGMQKDLITHLLIAKGLLTQEKRLIPVGWVDNYSEDEVHLAVRADVVQRLPLSELKV